MQTIEQAPVTEIERERPSSVEGGSTISVDGLHDAIQEMADSFDVSGFKCVKCGLVHQHDTTKHKISETFDITEDDAATQFEYNPVCHCGVQEAARHGSDFGIDEREASDIAEGAPVPPGTL